MRTLLPLTLLVCTLSAPVTLLAKTVATTTQTMDSARAGNRAPQNLEGPAAQPANKAGMPHEPMQLPPTPTDPVEPDPAIPDPNTPDPSTPDPAELDPAKPVPAKRDPAEPTPAEPDPVKPDPDLLDPAKAVPFKPDPMQSDPLKPPPKQADRQQASRRLQRQISAMEAQMKTIQATTEPSERQRLMQVHGTGMQESMRALRAMQGTTMQAGVAGKPMSAAQQASHHAALVQRMDLMEQMLEQMSQHKRAMAYKPKT